MLQILKVSLDVLYSDDDSCRCYCFTCDLADVKLVTKMKT